ncbi:hypothetical protein BBC0178_017710 [Bartonella apihabitans]|uniref:Uncharacterized protein n=1 Tax=Bartonella apihabitans TaxID=2750929 RepID=A0A1U9MD15_9HYPH|nr:hypothetical protein [Bartonella apihabitans]AQT43223.1 hypothetical protein BBC0178_017710 [Bartonella apihabitans]
MKQKPSPEKQKPIDCASGSIVPNSAPRATPAITANITHAANAANIMRPVNISRASNNANIANIANAAKFTPAAHKACLSFAPGFPALLPVLEALIANIANAAKFTPAAHKACLSFGPRFSCSFARFGSSYRKHCERRQIYACRA